MAVTLPSLLLALASLAEQIAREQPAKRCGHLAIKAKEAAKAMATTTSEGGGDVRDRL